MPLTRFELKLIKLYLYAAMEEQQKKLEANFRRFHFEEDEDPDEYGDKLILGECWTWQEPERVECWNIILCPISSHLSFVTKYQNCGESLPISLHETIIEVKTGPTN